MPLNDTFGGAAASLTAHTSDSGHAYIHPTTGTISTSGNSSAYISAASGGFDPDASNYTPAAADCDASAKVLVRTLLATDIGPLISQAGAANSAHNWNYYLGRLSVVAGGTSKYQIFKVSAGAFAQLGSDVTGPTLAAGNTLTLRLIRRGGVLTLLKDGVQVATATDGTPLANGPAGLWIGATAQTATTGIHATRLVASDPATATVSGPSSGAVGVESTAFTVTLSAASVGPTVVTLASGGSGDVFHATAGGGTVTSITVADGATTGTFYLVPGTSGARTITPTSVGIAVTPTTLSYTASSGAATAYTLTAPSPASGYVTRPSGNFTATPDGNFTGTITPSAGGGGGTFTPASLSWSGTGGAKTFTYTPASAGAKSISATNSGTLADPAAVAYTALARSLAVAPTTVPISATTAIALTGGGTTWTTTAPTFTPSGVSGVTIGSVAVTADATATAQVTAGTATGTLTIADSTTGATATLAVAVTATHTTFGDFHGLYQGTAGVGYTVHDAAGTEVRPRSTLGVVELTGIGSGLYSASFQAAPDSVYLVLWDTSGATDPALDRVRETSVATEEDVAAAVWTYIERTLTA